MKKHLRAYELIAGSPWIWIGLFYAFVLRARLVLGEWPIPYRPDPKVLGFHGHSLAVYLLFTIMPVAVLVWSVLTTERLGRREPVFRPSVFFWAGIASIALMVTLDPGRFVEWYLD